MDYCSVIWPNITETGATIAGLWGCFIAYKGLNTWRKQVIETRKIELAREIVEQFYNMKELIELVRCNFQSFSPQEIKNNFNKQDLTDQQCGYLYPVFIFNKNIDQVLLFQNMKNKAKVYYSKECEECFIEFIRIINSIKNACFDLSEDLVRSQDDKYNDKNETKELRAIIFNKENDSINTKMRDVIDEVEYNLKPLYVAKRTTWEKIKDKKGKNK